MTAESPTPPAYLLLGEILRPHGIRGELRMRVLTDYPERIATLEHVYLGAGVEARNIQRYVVEHLRMHQGYALLKLKEIETRNDAELLRDLFVMVSHDEAIPLEDDELYLYQLIGLAVHTTEGVVLGSITEVLETGANDVYIIASPDYGEILLPVIPSTVLNTDLEKGIVTVRVPEGLLPNSTA